LHSVVLATTAMSRGGVWRHIEDLALELRNRGHSCVIGLRDEAVELRRAAAEQELRVELLARTVRWRGWIWHGHLHDTFDRRFLAAAISRRLIGPTVLTEHLPRTNASDASLLPGPRRPLAKPGKTAFKRAEIASADRVIAVSPSSAEFISQRYKLRTEALDVVMNGIAPQARPVRTAAQNDTGPVRVLSVGSVIQQKGHELLLDAAQRAGARWNVTVIGDGRLRAPLSERALEHSLPVEFIGYSPAVADHLLRADIACLPSRWESCPYAALEAMSVGLPLVGADVDGLRDLIDHGVTGLLVPPNDPMALAAALDGLSADPRTRREMGEAGRTRVRTHTITRMTDETLAVYDRAHAGRRRNRA
jgi:glycosyltransferase involved in cell wall biosynthesis